MSRINRKVLIEIKPLTVNQVWQGKRFKTPAYKAYEKALLMLLPYKQHMDIPEGHLRLTITAGLSNSASDIDNIAKPFIDILQKKYGFNDKLIYQLMLNKQVVKKGDEFIEFELEAI